MKTRFNIDVEKILKFTPLIACLIVLLLACLYYARDARGAEPREILSGKQVYAVGVCGFKDNKFKAFAGNGLVAPKNIFDRFEQCAMFVEDKTLTPAWLVLLDNKGEPKEVIKWDDPSSFRRVWVAGTEI